MRLLLALLALSAALIVLLALADDSHAATIGKPTIYVSNTSTVVPDAVIADALPVWQAMISGEFARDWGADATLKFIGADAAPAGEWSLSIEDLTDSPGALGYHGHVDGAPYAKVFAMTSILDYSNWEVVATHEIEEMLADPTLNRVMQAGSRFYALEVSDPVENDRYALWRPSPTRVPVAVSDYVTWQWYTPGQAGPYDLAGKVKRPLQILHGGYATVWKHGNWVDIVPKGERPSWFADAVRP